MRSMFAGVSMRGCAAAEFPDQNQREGPALAPSDRQHWGSRRIDTPRPLSLKGRTARLVYGTSTCSFLRRAAFLCRPDSGIATVLST